LQLCERVHYRATKKNSWAKRSWTNPLNALQEAIHYSFIKFYIYCFSVGTNSLCTRPWESKKNYQHGLHAGPLEFQFLRPRECLTNPSRNLSLFFGVIGKTPSLYYRNNSVVNCLSASAIAIMSWQDVTRSPLCPSVKYCGTKRTHNYLFLKSSLRIPRTTVLRIFKETVIILDVIRWSFLNKSATAAMFTSVQVDFGRLPLSSSSSSSLPSRNQEYNLKTFIRSEPHSHNPFAPILPFLSQIDRSWNKILGQPSVHFSHPWRIKKTDFPGLV